MALLKTKSHSDSNLNMKITFILPGSSRIPMGGYKVVFEYANCLSERGHAVTIIHPAHLNEKAVWEEKLYHDVRYVLWRATGQFGPQGWFKLRPKVRMVWVHSLRERNIPSGDAVVATGWPTAEYVATYGADKGRKFYLLQHYETWWGPEERVRATWRLPLRKIVIAHWLEDIARELGETSTYIPNGLDFNAFGCDVPISQRLCPNVLMLSHALEWKGTADGMMAMKIARLAVPDLTATGFATLDSICLQSASIQAARTLQRSDGFYVPKLDGRMASSTGRGHDLWCSAGLY
jgi:hypothetical protein